MTTVITRLYADEETACDIARQLKSEGIPKRALKVVVADGKKGAALAEALKSAGVHPSAAAGYAERVAGALPRSWRKSTTSRSARRNSCAPSLLAQRWSRSRTQPKSSPVRTHLK